jgi:hypothetical protein
MTEIETDYLVIGAGAAGMAFADELIAQSDSDVVMVDRRHRPGGHWNDAYPFVRLHAPSTSYGVNSRVLGGDTIDTVGPNAGFYERASGAEICDYYLRVLEDHLLPSGQVRFFGMCNYLGERSGGHQFVSRLTGEVTTVRVRRKIVDGTYLKTSVPATHTPSFEVDPGVRFIPVGDLVRLSEPGTGYTVMGAGKTAMDACNWLLDNGVEPDEIRWIRPRDAWMWDRAFFQPLDLLTSFMEGSSLASEAAATAENVDDLFRRLEACGHLARLDPTVEPTMFRGAITSTAERDSLRQIERVVRQGRVVHLGIDRIVLQNGSIATGAGQVHVDCTADGFPVTPVRTIFEPGRITLQSVMGGLIPTNAALIAFVESARDDDADKNQLCPPNPMPSTAVDWISVMLKIWRVQAAWSNEPDITSWLERSRLSLTRGLGDHMTDPGMQSSLTRLAANMQPAMEKLEQLLAQATVTGA